MISSSVLLRFLFYVWAPIYLYTQLMRHHQERHFAAMISLVLLIIAVAVDLIISESLHRRLRRRLKILRPDAGDINANVALSGVVVQLVGSLQADTKQLNESCFRNPSNFNAKPIPVSAPSNLDLPAKRISDANALMPIQEIYGFRLSMQNWPDVAILLYFPDARRARLAEPLQPLPKPSQSKDFVIFVQDDSCFWTARPAPRPLLPSDWYVLQKGTTTEVEEALWYRLPLDVVSTIGPDGTWTTQCIVTGPPQRIG